ncbi:hypothetical protein ACEUZ9_000491 [Paracoccus litorisediminis]|uniref:hypothetical protein n=1 Tax=Paracoccus litorisediminis TaxID=2006130 RepID=UPI0037327197
MKYKDGFLAEHADLPRQIGWAPHQPDTLDAEGFFTAYGAETSFETIKAEIDDHVKSTFDAQEWDEEEGEEPEYDSIDDVSRDTIHRARVFENGDVHFFACDEDTQTGPANIGADESPIMILDRTQIYAAFGVDNPIAKPDYEQGIRKCEMIFHVIDEAQFREDFEVAEGEPIINAKMGAFFAPALCPDIGGELTHIVLERRGELLIATLTVNVTNADKLHVTAARLGRESGRDSDYVPEDTADAIFECWLGSNDGGSIVDYGIELSSWGEPQDDAPAGPRPDWA